MWLTDLHPACVCVPADAEHEARVERPPLFPPTFLYTQSWEDPEPDMKVRRGQEVAWSEAQAQSQDAPMSVKPLLRLAVLMHACQRVLGFPLCGHSI